MIPFIISNTVSLVCCQRTRDVFMAEIYKNEDRKCECFKCEFEEKCVYAYRYQRLGRENNGALGKCGKLKENNGKLQY